VPAGTASTKWVGKDWYTQFEGLACCDAIGFPIGDASAGSRFRFNERLLAPWWLRDPASCCGQSSSSGPAKLRYNKKRYAHPCLAVRGGDTGLLAWQAY
jgi:hypothetical protein